jgi:hypothetical protein
MTDTLTSESHSVDALAECKYCGVSIRKYRLDLHIRKKCPKRPGRTIENGLNGVVGQSQAAKTDKKVLVRSRLKRLYQDMSSDLSNVDDLQLAKLFKAFYTMYVWEGDGAQYAAARGRSVNHDGEVSTSLRTVSGGLPSLGKRAK